MQFAGIQKTTLLDYPGKVACLLFTYGCNMRCPFCHNPELVVRSAPPSAFISEDDIFKFLEKRKSLLDGVAITGGEPLLHKELPSFIRKVRKLGFKIKLDTNGSFPELLKKYDKIVDYWAMDVKNSDDLYYRTTGVEVDMQKIRASIKHIMQSGVDYEFRTTVIPGFHDEKSMQGVGRLVRGAKRFYIQNFIPSEMIDPTLKIVRGFSVKQLEEFKKILQKFVREVEVRNAVV